MLITIAAVSTAIIALAPLLIKIFDLITTLSKNEKAKTYAATAKRAVNLVEEEANSFIKEHPEAVVTAKGQTDQAIAEFQKDYPKIPVKEAYRWIKSALPEAGLGASNP